MTTTKPPKPLSRHNRELQERALERGRDIVRRYEAGPYPGAVESLSDIARDLGLSATRIQAIYAKTKAADAAPPTPSDPTPAHA